MSCLLAGYGIVLDLTLYGYFNVALAWLKDFAWHWKTKWRMYTIIQIYERVKNVGHSMVTMIMNFLSFKLCQVTKHC